MEILASNVRAALGSGASAAVPAGTRADLAALLTPGRVLSGVVLESPSPSQVLVGIGVHRVVLETAVALEPGRQLLLRVGAGEHGPVLDVLGTASGGESALLRSLRAVLGQDRPIGQLLHDLAARLREQGGSGTSALLAKLGQHVFQPQSGGEALRALVARTGLGHEAALLAALRSGLSREEAKALTTSLKAELLALLEDLPDGPLREAVARALAGVEAEQLLNLARRESREPLHFSFPVSDGPVQDGLRADASWTTAHVFWQRGGRDDGEGQGGGAEDATARLSLGVRFSATGPVRIDAWLRQHALDLRISVERPEVAARIQADLPALLERIEPALAASSPNHARSVQIVVGVAAREVVELEERAADIRYLREHHLMDVSG